MKKWKKIRTSMIISAISALGCFSHAAAADKLIVKGSDGTDKFVVKDTGAIGLGTNAPSGALHAKGSTVPTTQFLTQWVGTNKNSGGGFVGTYNGTSGTLPTAGDQLGYFHFGSFNGASRVTGGRLSARAEKDWSSTSLPTYLTLDTAPENSTGMVERMRIASNGNIGIGQPNPQQKLEVNGGVRLNTSTTKPTCAEAIRGTLWFTRGAVGYADSLQVCIKQADENYIWKNVIN